MYKWGHFNGFQSAARNLTVPMQNHQTGESKHAEHPGHPGGNSDGDVVAANDHDGRWRAARRRNRRALRSRDVFGALSLRRRSEQYFRLRDLELIAIRF